MNESKAHGISLLIKEKRELEREVDLLREEYLLSGDIERCSELLRKITFNDKQIQDIQDYLVPKTLKFDVKGKKKKKGFYLFGFKIF